MFEDEDGSYSQAVILCTGLRNLNLNLTSKSSMEGSDRMAGCTGSKLQFRVI